jgi:hypothetical protein
VRELCGERSGNATTLGDGCQVSVQSGGTCASADHGETRYNSLLPVKVLHKESELNCIEVHVIGSLWCIRVATAIQI